MQNSVAISQRGDDDRAAQPRDKGGRAGAGLGMRE